MTTTECAVPGCENDLTGVRFAINSDGGRVCPACWKHYQNHGTWPEVDE